MNAQVAIISESNVLLSRVSTQDFDRKAQGRAPIGVTWDSPSNWRDRIYGTPPTSKTRYASLEDWPALASTGGMVVSTPSLNASTDITLGSAVWEDAVSHHVKEDMLSHAIGEHRTSLILKGGHTTGGDQEQNYQVAEFIKPAEYTWDNDCFAAEEALKAYLEASHADH